METIAEQWMNQGIEKGREEGLAKGVAEAARQLVWRFGRNGR